jgi:hypothetical protein
MTNLTFNGKDYDIESLSLDAKNQLISLQAAEAEINHLNIKLAIAQTAKNAYAQALQSLLPKLPND